MSAPTRVAAAISDAMRAWEDMVGPSDVEAMQAAERSEACERRLRRLKASGAYESLERKVRAAIVADSGLRDTNSLGTVKVWRSRRDLARMLVINGNHGCGKSSAAGWAIAATDDQSVWVNVLDLERVFAAQFGDEVKQQERIVNARLLVIDDIGYEKSREAMCQTLYYILERRKQRDTIGTSNLSRERWFERYNEPRLVSRFREQAVFFTDLGPDLRGGGR